MCHRVWCLWSEKYALVISYWWLLLIWKLVTSQDVLQSDVDLQRQWAQLLKDVFSSLSVMEAVWKPVQILFWVIILLNITDNIFRARTTLALLNLFVFHKSFLKASTLYRGCSLNLMYLSYRILFIKFYLLSRETDMNTMFEKMSIDVRKKMQILR